MLTVFIVHFREFSLIEVHLIGAIDLSKLSYQKTKKYGEKKNRKEIANHQVSVTTKVWQTYVLHSSTLKTFLAFSIFFFHFIHAFLKK